MIWYNIYERRSAQSTVFMVTYTEKKYVYTPEEKSSYWEIGKNLQSVDGLDTSEYLDYLARQEINGELSLEDVQKALAEYYQQRPEDETRTKEADIVSGRIVEYLRTAEFSLHPLALKQIHRVIFEGFSDYRPGEYRKMNISKSEPVLFGKSVRYEDYRNIEDYLEYDIREEQKRQEKGFATDTESTAEFISGLWQIHPFSEGNTRTVAVFTIQYLKSLGYEINNDPFEKNARYFRDSLVRAVYNDAVNGITPEKKYLVRFLQNVMEGQQHLLSSKNLIVPGLYKA